MPDAEGPAPADPAVVGSVVRPHALRGEVVVRPMDAAVAHFEVGRRLWVDGRWRRVTRARVQGERWLIGLEGIVDRDAAETLRGVELLVEADSLPPLEEGRYYVHELVGCRLETPAGAKLGTVVGVVEGPQSWLEVDADGRRILVPMAKALLCEVDIQARRIVMDPPEGLDATVRPDRS